VRPKLNVNSHLFSGQMPLPASASRGVRWFLLFSASLAFCLCGCEEPLPPAVPDPLRVGVVPYQPKERLEDVYGPLVRYLGKALGVRAELVIPDSFTEFEEMFHNKELDLALFGAVTFIQEEHRDGAVPLAMRILDRHIVSVVITRAGVEGKFPDDFRGRSFCFGERLSTSGNWMPRYFFGQKNLVPEKFFGSVTTMPHHDAVIAAVQDGRVDAGVVSAMLLRRRFETGAIDPRRIRLLWESPGYADYVWAVPRQFPIPLRARIRDAFLALDPGTPEHQSVLSPLETRAFIPATRADFDQMRQIVIGGSEHSRP